MAPEVNVRIELATEPTPESSQWLQNLHFELQKDLETSCNLEYLRAPKDTQDPGLAAAIAIIGLSLSIFDRLLAMTRHYKEQGRRGSITIKGDGYSWTKESLTDEELLEIVKDIERSQAKSIIIQVD